MDYTTRSPSLQRLSKQEGDWIYYKLRSHDISCLKVATDSNVSLPLVSMVLRGERSSAPVYETFCKLLGYSSMTHLLAEARTSVA